MIASIKSLLKRSRIEDLLRLLVRVTFQALVLLLPTQLALHFWPQWAYVYGFRIDYFSPTLYLTDVFIVLILAFWFVQTRFHKKKHPKSKSVKYQNWLVVFLVLVFIGLNILLAIRPELAVYKWVKIVEFIFIGFFITRIEEFDFTSWVLKPLSYSLIAVSLIALAQFGLQRTVGGFLYWLGERNFTIITPGIATFSLRGRELLRPYSIFPHPNVLAGYLSASVLLLAYSSKEKFKKTLYFRISLVISLVVILLSFSQGAWVALSLVALLLFIGVFSDSFLKKACVGIFFTTIVFSIMLPVVSDRLTIGSYQTETIKHRLYLAKSSGILIADRPVLGVGAGNFILGLVEVENFPSVSWWLQPSHNIFLVIFSEMGIIGLALFIALLFVTFKKILSEKDRKLLAPLLFVLLSGLVDHYWITLQQTQLLLTIIIATSLRKNKA